MNIFLRGVLISASVLLISWAGQGSLAGEFRSGPQNAVAASCGGTAENESTCQDGKIKQCRCFSDGCALEDTGSPCGGGSSGGGSSSGGSRSCGGTAENESTCQDGKIKQCRCFSDGCALEDTGSPCGDSGGAGSQPTSAPATANCDAAGGGGVNTAVCSSQSNNQQQTNTQEQTNDQTNTQTNDQNTTATGGDSSSSSTATATGGTATSTGGSSTGGANTTTVTASGGAGGQGGAGGSVSGVSSSSTSNPNLVVNLTGSTTGTAQASAPKTVKVAGVSSTQQVKELPKTGLPILFWAAAAFLPLGFRLKRFGGNNLTRVSSDIPYLLSQKRKIRVH